ncbi:hypothetical protein MKW92_009042 [Papaver armeniacum]|nr:hypothetical protein MKW92_009042 [Papaver armeniacum]
MDSNGRCSYWCYICSTFVRGDLGVCSKCESFVEEIEAPYTESKIVSFLSDTMNQLSDDKNYKYRPRKCENHLRRLILAIVIRGCDDGVGGGESGSFDELYVDNGSGLQPCSSILNDCVRNSKYDRALAQLAEEHYGLCDHQRASKAVVEKTMPVTEIPRIILCELIINVRSDSAIKKVFRNVFSFCRRDSSPGRYWKLVDRKGLHWQRFR